MPFISVSISLFETYAYYQNRHFHFSVFYSFFINKIHFGCSNKMSKDTDVGKDGNVVESDLSTDTI